ncbi:MAG: PqqD family protein [Elusimicrobia bacterium]|nr:PqqD family protein [Elusimicrobiota bacterium]
MKVSIKKDNIAWRVIDGQAYIVTPKTSHLHMLNKIGTKIWLLIDKGIEVNEVVRRICEEFEVDKKTAARDVNDFIKTLERDDILVRDEKK